MKSRFLSEIIKKKSNTKFGKIIVLTGARQTGKTTLVKKIFPDFKYLSIEDPLLRIDLKKLYAQQFYNYYSKAILDEIQKEPTLIEQIKSVYDQYDDVNYILLGSSKILLLKNVKESLAGRCSIFEVYPLTLPELRTNKFGEKIHYSLFQQLIINGKIPDIPPGFRLCANYNQINQAYEFYLKYGGYPAITDNSLSDEERKEWLKNYVKTYLERDVRDLAEIKNLDPFIRIQKVSALLTGQIINHSTLAKEAGVSTATAQRFLNYMDLSYQIIKIQAWYKNKLKRLIKSPKLHFLDPGILQTITGKYGELAGTEFESAIVAEIYKQLKYLNVNVSIYFLRTFDDREIDLLVETDNGYYAFEIKSTTNVTKADLRNFKNIESILDKPLLHCLLLSNDVDTKKFDKNITAVHAALFLG